MSQKSWFLAASVAAVAMLTLSGCEQSTTAPVASESTAAQSAPEPSVKKDAVVAGTSRPKAVPAAAKDKSVEASQYRGSYGSESNSYYFRSPSGKFSCSIRSDVTGCNSDSFPSWAPRVEAPSFDTMVAPNEVSFSPGRRAQLAYTGEAVHYKLDATGSNYVETRVLPYGSTLTAYGVTCTVSKDKGVACSEGSHGFQVASSGYTLR